MARGPTAAPRVTLRVSEKTKTLAPSAPPTKGTLEIAPTRVDHRVFFDGRVIGESSPDVRYFEVPCGWRAVQIGSKGTVQEVLVSCGGVTRVERK
jgi:hypothetical protein